MPQTQAQKRPHETDVMLEKLFIEASREKILGNIDDAIAIYSEVTKKDNNNAVAHYELGRLYQKKGQINKAAEAAAQAVTLDPKDLTYLDLYTKLLEKQGDFKRAADLCAKASDYYPEDPDLYFRWAHFLKKSGKADQAIKVLSSLEKKMGIRETTSMRKYMLYMSIDKSKKAVQELERLTEAYPEEPEYVVRLANFHASNEDLDLAKTLYKKALDLDPNHPTANIAMVEFFLQEGDTMSYLNALAKTFSQPQQDWNTQLITIKKLAQQVDAGVLGSKYYGAINNICAEFTRQYPSNATANIIQGNLLFKQQQYHEAIPYYSKAVKWDRANLPLWNKFLHCLLVDHKQELFQKKSQQFVDLFPSQASAIYYEGVAKFQQGDYKKAKKLLEEANDIAVTNMSLQSNALRFLAQIADQEEKFEQSDNAFQEAILKDPNNLNAINDYVNSLLLRKADQQKANELLDGLLQKAPNNGDYQTTKGFLLFRKGEYAAAATTLQKAAQLPYHPPVAHAELLGDVYFKLNEADKALEYWQKSAQQGGNSERLKRKISTKQFYE